MIVVYLLVSYHPVEGIHNFCSHRVFEVNQASADGEREGNLKSPKTCLFKHMPLEVELAQLSLELY